MAIIDQNGSIDMEVGNENGNGSIHNDVVQQQQQQQHQQQSVPVQHAQPQAHAQAQKLPSANNIFFTAFMTVLAARERNGLPRECTPEEVDEEIKKVKERYQAENPGAVFPNRKSCFQTPLSRVRTGESCGVCKQISWDPVRKVLYPSTQNAASATTAASSGQSSANVATPSPQPPSATTTASAAPVSTSSVSSSIAAAAAMPPPSPSSQRSPTTPSMVIANMKPSGPYYFVKALEHLKKEGNPRATHQDVKRVLEENFMDDIKRTHPDSSFPAFCVTTPARKIRNGELEGVLKLVRWEKVGDGYIYELKDYVDEGVVSNPTPSRSSNLSKRRRGDESGTDDSVSQPPRKQYDFGDGDSSEDDEGSGSDTDDDDDGDAMPAGQRGSKPKRPLRMRQTQGSAAAAKLSSASPSMSPSPSPATVPSVPSRDVPDFRLQDGSNPPKRQSQYATRLQTQQQNKQSSSASSSSSSSTKTAAQQQKQAEQEQQSQQQQQQQQIPLATLSMMLSGAAPLSVSSICLNLEQQMSLLLEQKVLEERRRVELESRKREEAKQAALRQKDNELQRMRASMLALTTAVGEVLSANDNDSSLVSLAQNVVATLESSESNHAEAARMVHRLADALRQQQQPPTPTATELATTTPSFPSPSPASSRQQPTRSGSDVGGGGDDDDYETSSASADE